jgi:glycosyltransferase involved in cell wall biosynthesis
VLTVSVIIPTYDRPDKLVRCVESVLKQRRLPDEILVIDDASSCSYDEAVERLQDRISNMEGTVELAYVRLDEGGGGSFARNQGARRARGDLLMFVDDDDTWEPAKVERQVRLFDVRSDAGLVYSGRRAVDEHGRCLYEIPAQAEGDIFRRLLQGNCIGTTSSVAVEADVFRRAGGFDEDLPALQDYDLWIRAARRTRVACDPAHTVNWTVHATASDQMAGDPAIYEEAYDRITKKYAGAIRGLSPRERRLRTATQYASIADKYARTGDLTNQWVYALRSLLAYPTLAGASRLLPFSLWMALRRLSGGR